MLPPYCRFDQKDLQSRQTPEALWLLDHSVQPFQAVIDIKGRRPVQLPGPDVQTAAKARCRFDLQHVPVPDDEILLLRRTEGDAQEIGPAFVDLPYDGRFLFFLEVAVPETRDLQTRNLFLQIRRGHFRHAGLAAQQIDAAAQLRAEFDGAAGEIDAGDLPSGASAVTGWYLWGEDGKLYLMNNTPILAGEGFAITNTDGDDTYLTVPSAL